MFRMNGEKLKHIYKYPYPNMGTYINDPFKGKMRRTIWNGCDKSSLYSRTSAAPRNILSTLPR